MTDVRNRSFVHRCQIWLANNVTGVENFNLLNWVMQT